LARLKKQIEQTKWCNIVAWVDKAYETQEGKRLGLVGPEFLKESSFEVVLIGIDKEDIAMEIMKDIKKVKRNIEILWKKPRKE